MEFQKTPQETQDLHIAQVSKLPDTTNAYRHVVDVASRRPADGVN
jgi:hypothetical protein